MKDILNLFRRDAEADEHHGSVGLGLGEKTRVLSPVGDQDQKGGRGAGKEGAARVGDLRVSPPVVEKGRAQSRDEGVWGRRW